MNPLTAALLSLTIAAAPGLAAPIAQPTATATPAAPTAADVTAKLTAAADYSKEHSGRAVLVMHAGKTIFERYDRGWNADRPHPLASGTKSFTGVLAMFAVQDGLLTLDEKACDTLTEWKTDPLKSQITVRHLLTLSSGLDPSDAELGGRGGGKLLGEGAANRAKRLDRENKPQADDNFAGAIAVPMLSKPGEKFRYGPSHFFAFGELLERKLRASSIPQKTVLDYMHARLFDPIGLKVAWFGKDSAGHPNLPGGCLLTAREWIKFGEFVRLNGSWKQADGASNQLLKPDLLAECFKPSAANKSYGLTWWLRNAEVDEDNAASIADGGGNDEKPMPDPTNDRRSLRDRLADRLRERELKRQNTAMTAPGGKKVTVHMAAGLGKQRLYILPEYDLVVVRFAEATRAGQGFDDREFLTPIVEALAPAAPTPAPSDPKR